ncbi:hypothetical protein PybrP1_001118 [[Pythium] brassicae (nom. inval.)]|nr:hypothetical protein PybrP1_001118 [[Pythium] brassicae (nom. inval.)]
MTLADADGHVLGNFHAYYSFNPVDERLRFMDAAMSRAVQAALLALESRSEATEGTSTTVLDVGCNEGDLTLGLYNALGGTNASSRRAQPVDQSNGGGSVNADVTMSDVSSFDAGSTSALNDLAQKQKRRVEFVVRDVGGSSHRKLFACEVRVDGAAVGCGEGVSKKVAKAKAAEAALRVLCQQAAGEQDAVGAAVLAGDADSDGSKEPTDSEAIKRDGADGDVTQSDDTEQVSGAGEAASAPVAVACERKKLFVLGVDIDQVLVDRAALKAVDVAAGDAVQFRCADVSAPAFDDAVRSFLALATRAPSQRQFDLVTCFSVTMWIHLNKGDDGLWKFLERVSDLASHLLIEPQPWKCYRNAQKRLSRMRVEIPASFREIQVRQDVVERIDAFLLAAGRFRFKAPLGKTNWSRPVVLYSRTKIPGLVYAD